MTWGLLHCNLCSLVTWDFLISTGLPRHVVPDAGDAGVVRSSAHVKFPWRWSCSPDVIVHLLQLLAHSERLRHALTASPRTPARTSFQPAPRRRTIRATTDGRRTRESTRSCEYNRLVLFWCVYYFGVCSWKCLHFSFIDVSYLDDMILVIFILFNHVMNSLYRWLTC